MEFLKPLIVTALTIFLLAYFVPAISYLNWSTLLIASIVLTILQKVIKPILKVLFLPINILTLGLFSLVINVFILWLAAYLVPGFRINNLIIFGVALSPFFSLLTVSAMIGFIQNIFNKILKA